MRWRWLGRGGAGLGGSEVAEDGEPAGDGAGGVDNGAISGGDVARLDASIGGGFLVSDILAGKNFFEARPQKGEGFAADDVGDEAADDLVNGLAEPVGKELVDPEVFEFAATTMNGSSGVVSEKVEMTGSEGEVALGCLQSSLRGDTSGRFGNDANGIAEFAARIADSVDGQVGGNDVAALGEVASFEAVAVDLTVREFAGEVDLASKIGGMSDVVEVQALEFLRSIAEKFGEPGIGAEMVAVRGYVAHADGGLLEGKAETLLGFTQRFAGTLQG